jgi:putative FmdB family regulatory protein
MPIYEYECDECRCRFDKRQLFQDEAKADCPKCKGKSKRIMVPSPVIFKGSGFYVNDYPNQRPEASPTEKGPPKANPTEKSPVKVGSSEKSPVKANSTSAKSSKSEG